VFLASATLSDAVGFGATLLGVDRRELVHVADSTKQDIKSVAANQLPDILDHPPSGGLLRGVLLMDKDRGAVRTELFLSEVTRIGESLNVIYFVESKFHGRLIARRLSGAKSHGKRRVVIYDADLLPPNAGASRKNSTPGGRRA
jgi:hypothetical protein